MPLVSLESFDSFAEKISSMPASAVLKSMDLECKLLEEDLDGYRASFTGDEFSILYFRQFLRTARSGEMMHCIRCFPKSHIEFYKRTVARLIQAGELKSSALDRFDGAFAAARHN
jgi:hypothetical protein